MKYEAADYLREDKLPHLWCSGCSHGIVMGAVARALAALEIPASKTVIVTGIGCFGKADDYFATHALHGTHGRAIAFATGIKAVRKDLKVLALMGDGDSATIGGNHLIHAARRNIDITAIVSNNYNYGMTGGQYSATTPADSKTSTSPYGNPEDGFDLCSLVQGAGGGYVARTTPFHVKSIEKLITEAILYKGFSFVEIVACCPTYYGRYNRAGDASKMVETIKKRAVSKEKYARLMPEKRIGLFTIGELHKEKKADFSERYREIQKKAGDF
jgi:2-oxoglutarate/2-oxoacid ferredoxin oxidoreductase subunit beta